MKEIKRDVCKETQLVETTGTKLLNVRAEMENLFLLFHLSVLISPDSMFQTRAG